MNARRFGFFSILLLILSLGTLHDLSARDGSGGGERRDTPASMQAAEMSIQAEPDSGIDFGNVYINDAEVRYIKVTRTGGFPMLRPRIVSADSTQFTIDETFNWIFGGRVDTFSVDTAYVAVSFKPTRAGMIFGWVFFTSEDGLLVDSLSIHGVGLQFRVSESLIDFGNVTAPAGSGCAVREVTIENLLKGDEFYVDLPNTINVSGYPGAFSVSYEPGPSQSRVTSQSLLPLLSPDPWSRQRLLVRNDQDAERCERTIDRHFPYRERRHEGGGQRQSQAGGRGARFRLRSGREVGYALVRDR